MASEEASHGRNDSNDRHYLDAKILDLEEKLKTATEHEYDLEKKVVAATEYGQEQKQRADDEKKRADDEKKRAEDEKKRADDEKKRADDERKRTNGAKKLALTYKKGHNVYKEQTDTLKKQVARLTNSLVVEKAWTLKAKKLADSEKERADNASYLLSKGTDHPTKLQVWAISEKRRADEAREQAREEEEQVKDSYAEILETSLKRAATQSPEPGPIAKMSKVSAHRKVKSCVKCYAEGLECDNEEACQSCDLIGMRRECKRIRCNNFGTGACVDASCPYVHKGDGYRYLLQHTELRRRIPDEHEPAKA